MPRCIFLSHDLAERELLAEALSIKAGRKVEIAVPQRGEKAGLVAHALINAKEALGRKMADASSQAKLLDGVAAAFGLASRPARIEVYDNSHIQGTNAVGRDDRRRAGRLREEPVPQVQHQVRGAHPRRRLRHDERGAAAAVHAAGEGDGGIVDPLPQGGGRRVSAG